MKTAAALINTTALVALVALTSVEARPMHDGINYERYLAEQDEVDGELDAWLNKYEKDGQKNGWLPQTEFRSADEEKEDRKQRFFMAKELVKDLATKNPKAKFSTDSPFTLMTTDEFAKYVRNSYLAGDATRKLRGNYRGQASESQEGGHGHGGWGHRQSRHWSGPSNESGGTGESNGKVKAFSSFGSSDFDWKNFDWKNIDWSSIFDRFNPKKPNTPDEPETYAPEPATPVTYAPEPATPVTYAPEPVTPETPAPETPAPETPVPETPAPESSEPSGPVGPVAPSPSPGNPNTPAPSNNDAAADGNGVDWSVNACMPPVQNQGGCGSCWSFSTIAAVETGKCIADGSASYTKYSEEGLAACDPQNGGCMGGVPYYAFQYMQENGVCSGEEVPYAPATGGDLGACPQNCKKTQVGITGIDAIRGEDALISALKTHPIALAVTAGNEAWKQYSSGIMTADACGNQQLDHAVLAVGYDDSMLKIRNSWGDAWGEAGYVRLERASGPNGMGTCGVLTDMLDISF